MLKIETFALGPLQVNTYLLYDQQQQLAICLDPGEDAQILKEAITDRGLKLEKILLTHGHFDHIYGVAGLAQESGAEVFLHQDDLFMLNNLSETALYYGFSQIQKPKIDQTLGGEEVIDFAGKQIKVLHTPGHSPGSVTYSIDKHLFVGDLIFSGSVGRSDLPGGNHQQLISSVKEKIWPFSAETIIHPGHGEKTTVGAEKRMNPFFAEENND